MRKGEWMKSAVIVAVLCLAGLISYAQEQSSSQQTGDPVADAARKAREEKKNGQKPKKVFTDDDVKPANQSGEKPSVQNAGVTNSAEGKADATVVKKPGDATKKENAEEKEDPNSEKAWRKRFSEQHAKITRAE